MERTADARDRLRECPAHYSHRFRDAEVAGPLDLCGDILNGVTYSMYALCDELESSGQGKPTNHGNPGVLNVRSYAEYFTRVRMVLTTRAVTVSSRISRPTI